jgi:hypothetical protein
MTHQLKASTTFLWGPDGRPGRNPADYERAAAELCARVEWSLSKVFGPELISEFSAPRQIAFDAEGFVPEQERQRALEEGLDVLRRVPVKKLAEQIDSVHMNIDGWSDIGVSQEADQVTMASHGLAEQSREWTYEDCGPVVKCYHPYGFLMNDKSVMLNLPEATADYAVRLYVQLQYEIPKAALKAALDFDVS